MGAYHARPGEICIRSEDISYDNVTDLIGQGGVCCVFRAKLKGGAKTVALKRLQEDIRIVPKRHEECMRREARCLKNLFHANVVQFLGVVWEQSFHAIVLEYLVNQDLQTFIHNNRLSVFLKAKLLCDVSQGINYLHWLPKKIVHNDLKAGNVLVSDSIVAKISDFGLADWKSFTTDMFYIQTSDEKKPRGATNTHRSPERWLNINISSTMSDVYSFGILIWEVYSEMEPFYNNNSKAIECAVTRGQRPDENILPDDMPSEIKQLMESCWHQEPLQRPVMGYVMKVLATVQLRSDIDVEIRKTMTKLAISPANQSEENCLDNVSASCKKKCLPHLFVLCV